jgi:hypothetical protein
MCLLASCLDDELLSAAPALAEPPAALLGEALPLHEKTLAAVWNAQRPLQGPFWTTALEPVAIIYRGLWAGGAGPDFRGAIVAFGANRPQRGDIELHLRAADWYAHGHHTDPAYNDVLLHVVYSLGGSADGPARLADARRARTAAGREVPTLVLAPHITADAATLAALDFPAQLGDLSEEPCWQRTAHRPLSEVLQVLGAAGDARFAEKAARYEADLAVALDGLPAHEHEAAAEQILYAGLCDGLGYSANRAPFGGLAVRLPLRLLHLIAGDRPTADRTVVLEAVLLGGAGLLPSQRKLNKTLDWQSAAQADELERQWAALRPLLGHVLSDGTASLGWKFAGVRPANAPTRRVAALAHLLSWLLPGGLLPGFLAATARDPAPADLAARWLARLHVAAGGSFWSEYSDFGAHLGGAGSTADLIGQDRAGELLVNVVLPIKAAWSAHTDQPALAATARAVYAAHPRLADNQVTRTMLGEVLGPRARQARLGAREQQGLIGLHRRYCAVRDIYECPLSGLRRPL